MDETGRLGHLQQCMADTSNVHHLSDRLLRADAAAAASDQQ